VSDTKLVLKSIADACDRESLARAGGCLFRYVQEETVLRDCGHRGVCRTPPGCARHWEERNRELVRENEVLREAGERLRAVRKLLEENGCDCQCDHHPDERGDDCEVCLGCRIGEAVGK